MTNEENKEYMKAQIHDIEVYKWLESEKAGYDLGEQAVKDYIKNGKAKEFRDNWEENHS